MSDFNNWNRPFKKPRTEKKRPPPGLRGKEIGMYFKNQSLKNKLHGKQKKDFSITFTMPPSVALAMKKNIKFIIKTAQEENIILPPLKNIYLNEPSSIKTEVIKPEYSNERIIKRFDEIKVCYAKANTNCDTNVNTESDRSLVKLEPEDESSSNQENSINIDLSIVKNEHLENTSIIQEIPGNVNNSSCQSITERLQNYRMKQNMQSAAVQKNQDEINNQPSTSHSVDCEQALSNKEDYSCPSTSTAATVIPAFSGYQIETSDREMTLKSSFKYGYEDIITGMFDEKLEERLAMGIGITKRNAETDLQNIAFHNEYKDMIQKSQYKKMLEFRKLLPTYNKSKEILDTISKNQVVVISGETGCGKSTQVPQIILDDAICNLKGANVKVLVTEPRRIAASSLAMRVAEERAEKLGNSVGYAVRLERVTERSVASIQYCTTGILLTDLEVNQSLENFSHIVLDEVHERDCHIDLAMLMLKKVLKKRKDLKVILMSATIDSDSLAAYFDNCVKMHIEGLAYPVRDIYLEEVLQITRFHMPENKNNRNQNSHKHKRFNRQKHLEKVDDTESRKEKQYQFEFSEWLKTKQHILDPHVMRTLRNPDVEEMNLDLIVELLAYICNGPPGAVLIFLPGYGEISNLMKLLGPKFPPSRYQIHALHSKLPSLEQHRIFQRPPGHQRKIIIATNIAETSITVDDIVYVIDCGRHKISGLNVERNYETLDVQLISKANLRQRRGRAGRCQPGICYHLLTSFRAERLEERALPELQRSNLLEPVLMIKRLRLGLAGEALQHVPSPPAASSVQWAVKHLQRCGALESGEKLTPLGWHMARLPLHPAAGKLVLLGALFGCLDRAASVAAVWGFKDPFVLVVGKEREIEEVKRVLTMGEPSDHIAVSEAIITWEQCPVKHGRDFCYNNFLSNNTMLLLSNMKKQLGENLKSMGFLPSGNVKSDWENRNTYNFSLFKAIVAAALYPNVATVRWTGLRSKRHNAKIRIIARTPEEGRVAIHPSSAMCGDQAPRMAKRLLSNQPGANWLVYWMKRQSSSLFIFDVTLIYSLPLLFFGDFILTKNLEARDECFLEVSTIKVRVKNETADLLHDLRTLLDHVLASKVNFSSSLATSTPKFEDQVLNTVMELITAEDQQAEYMTADLTDSEHSEYDDGESSFNDYY